MATVTATGQPPTGSPPCRQTRHNRPPLRSRRSDGFAPVPIPRRALCRSCAPWQRSRVRVRIVCRRSRADGFGNGQGNGATVPTGSPRPASTMPPTGSGGQPWRQSRHRAADGHGFGNSQGDGATADGFAVRPAVRIVCRRVRHHAADGDRFGNGDGFGRERATVRHHAAKRAKTARRGVPAVRTGSRPSRFTAAPCAVPVRRGDGHGFATVKATGQPFAVRRGNRADGDRFGRATVRRVPFPASRFHYAADGFGNRPPLRLCSRQIKPRQGLSHLIKRNAGLFREGSATGNRPAARARCGNKRNPAASRFPSRSHAKQSREFVPRPAIIPPASRLSREYSPRPVPCGLYENILKLYGN